MDIFFRPVQKLFKNYFMVFININKTEALIFSQQLTIYVILIRLKSVFLKNVLGKLVPRPVHVFLILDFIFYSLKTEKNVNNSYLATLHYYFLEPNEWNFGVTGVI